MLGDVLGKVIRCVGLGTLEVCGTIGRLKYISLGTLRVASNRSSRHRVEFCTDVLRAKYLKRGKY